MYNQFASYLKRKILEISLSRGEIITQTEFAKILGIPQGSLSQYMNGSRLPSDVTAQKIAQELGNEVYHVLGMPLPMPDDPNIASLIQAYQALPSNKKQTYLNSMIDEAKKYK